MSQAHHISYLQELNRELVKELTHKDFLLTSLNAMLSKQQQAFKLLVELQKAIAVAESNEALFKAVTKLINASLGMMATYIYKPSEQDPGKYIIFSHYISNRLKEGYSRNIETISLDKLAESGGYILVNNDLQDQTAQKLREKFNLTSMIVCPVFYNNEINRVIITGVNLVDDSMHLDLDHQDANTIEAVAILISSYLRKIELVKLYETDRIKTEFVSNLSHEFRTPLTLVLGLLEELKKKFILEMPDEDLDSLEIVIKNAFRIEQLIDQLLDISRLETETESLSLKNCDLAELVSRISKSFSSLAQKSRLSFNYSFSSTSEDTWFDEDKLEKIITNLLSNAFKYTQKDGRINFTVNLDRSDRGLFATFSVKDNGPGIPPLEQDRIFERFYQVKSAGRMKAEGTGVGLYLVKKLTELHHGTIELKSKVKAGSEFIISLPMDRDAYSEEEMFTHIDVLPPEEEMLPENGLYPEDGLHPVPEKSIADKRPYILIVEDNKDLNAFIADNLSKSFRILRAFNGIEGLELAENHIPDLIVTDVMMPELDGVEMSKLLKKGDKTRHIPILMLTAKADKRSRYEGLECGADDYIIKPFDMEELALKVKNHIESSTRLRKKFRKEFISAPNEIDLISPDDRLVSSVIELMRENVSNPDFHLEDACEKLSISKAQLYRKIDALTGYSPGELFRVIRLKTAASLFCNGHKNVAQVMYMVGFNNQSNFARIFRKHFNVNPAEYIKHQADTKNVIASE